MIKKFITISAVFLMGLGTGIFLSAIHSGIKDNNPEKVKVTQISGAGITHDSFIYSNKEKISFYTKSDGIGNIFTEIPKKNIPEARSWMEKRNSIQGEVTFLNGPLYSISYWRRWESITIGAGITASKDIAGVKIGAGYWW